MKKYNHDQINKFFKKKKNLFLMKLNMQKTL